MIREQTTITALLELVERELAKHKYMDVNHPLIHARDDLLLCGDDLVLRVRAAADAVRAIQERAA